MSSDHLTKYQRFENVRVWRHELRPHPKNPRTIGKKQEQRLRGKVKDVGLVQPLIWNRRTGYLVGGHQRMEVLDRLEKYNALTRENDYQLDVSACELSDAQELEMLVFLNNPSASGSFDLDLLADLNLSAGIDFAGMGFDQIDVDLMFDGDARFSHLFEDDDEVAASKEKLAEVKAAREAGAERMQGENSAEFYFVVVCRDDEERTECMRRLGVPKHEQFVSGDSLLGATEG
ncbi:MAG: hypothetical protein PHD19_11635 [Dechloromonas sp.]|nr:hypothetical protein [Dechloromonas sp.]